MVRRVGADLRAAGRWSGSATCGCGEAVGAGRWRRIAEAWSWISRTYSSSSDRRRTGLVEIVVGGVQFQRQARLLGHQEVDLVHRPAGERHVHVAWQLAAEQPGGSRGSGSTRCAEAAMHLPVRGSENSMSQRSLRSTTRAATYVSQVRLGLVRGANPVPSNWPEHYLGGIQAGAADDLLPGGLQFQRAQAGPAVHGDLQRPPGTGGSPACRRRRSHHRTGGADSSVSGTSICTDSACWRFQRQANIHSANLRRITRSWVASLPGMVDPVAPAARPEPVDDWSSSRKSARDAPNRFSYTTHGLLGRPVIYNAFVATAKATAEQPGSWTSCGHRPAVEAHADHVEQLPGCRC